MENKNLLVLFFLFFISFSSVAQTTHEVIMAPGNSFLDENTTIKKGDKVKFINEDNMKHTATSGTNCTSDNKWWTGDVPGGNNFVTLTFNEVGVFPYFCEYHCGSGMTGTITVENVTGTRKSFSTIALKNYPNPVKSDLIVEFSLEEASSVSIELVNTLGEKVVTLAENTKLTAGEHSYQFNVDNLQAGTYLLRVTDNESILGSELVVKSE